MSTESRLSRVYKEAERISVNSYSKIVLMSDCHRGVGNWGDNFLLNQNLFFAALRYYDKQQFTYIELGDGDELWENRNMKQIVQAHSDAFWLMSQMYKQGRLYMLFGNHDKKKKNKKYIKSTCEQYYCESEGSMCELFPGLKVSEGLVLKNDCTGQELFLTHGHQGDLLNDTFWSLGRFLVRYVWRNLELLGILDPTSAAKNYTKKNKIEKKLNAWADYQGTILITGHTHRPVFPTPGKGLYFNDGSCVHPRCITALEIEKGAITLVKWCVMTKEDRTMYVGREVLEGPVCLYEYFNPLQDVF